MILRGLVLLVALTLTLSSCSVWNAGLEKPQIKGDFEYDLAPECRQRPTAQLCDDLLKQLSEVRLEFPSTREVGITRVGPTGDGRYLVTATLMITAGDPELNARHYEMWLPERGWTRVESPLLHQRWSGTDSRAGWLLDLAFTAEGDGTKLAVSIFAPSPKAS